MVYAPAGVAGGTETMPVVGSSAGTLMLPAGAPKIGAAGVLTVKVALAVAPATIAATPLTLSLPMTLPALVLPVAPLGTLKMSGVATSGDTMTVTLMVASLQLVGLTKSHSL